MKDRLQDDNLKKVIELGIAFHHAGLCKEDRLLVEDLFS